MKIIIIDSGIDKSYDIFKRCIINGYSIINGKLDSDYNDEFGHGTAVASIICKNIKDVFELLCVKIFKNEFAESNDLLIALNLIYETEDPSIINISAGVTQTELKYELNEICSKLREKGFIIIAGYDNYGAISYPAYFDNVIGVVGSNQLKRNEEYIYVENSPVNIIAKGVAQTLLWKNGETNYVSGSSFSVPYITIKLYNLFKKYNDYKTIIDIFKRDAININYLHGNKNIEKWNNNVKNAVIFPFNKETHALIRNQQALSFNIVGIYNFKHLGNVGKNTKELLNTDNEYIIQNIQKLDWTEKFDLFILSHYDQVVEIINFNIEKEIIDKCLKYNKNLFLFDDRILTDEIKQKFKDKGLYIYTSKYDNLDLNNNYDKLFIYNTPVISILGTSSKQGKFSLQLSLVQKFIDLGYNVGQLGTEPNSELFGMDFAFPIGFNSNIRTSGSAIIQKINYLMNIIDDKKYDLIITSGQSNCIPYQIRNLQDISLNSYEFLLGTNPDVVLLCVNYEDELEYILRTIKYVEGLVDCKVLALVLFPLKKRITWSGLYMDNDLYELEDLINKAKNLTELTNIKVFINGDNEDLNSIANLCIEYLSK